MLTPKTGPKNGVTEGAIAEPIRCPFDLQIPIHATSNTNKLNSYENKGKAPLSKAEIRDQIQLCFQVENLTIQQTANRIGISVITVRRISRTLKVGPYREMASTVVRSKSSQSPYGWGKIQGILERHPREWKWVELAFKLRSEGKSLRKIAAHLNGLNVASKNGRTWSAKTISQTLKWNEPHLKKQSQRR